jgi:hypothetical protein
MYKFALIQLRNDETNVITRYDLCSMFNAKSEEKKLKIEIIQKVQIGSNTISNDLPKDRRNTLKKFFFGNMQYVKVSGETYLN